MSKRNQNGSVFGESESEIWQTVEAAIGKVSPKLIQELDTDGDGEVEIRREVDPIAVTRLGGTLPFDTDSEQLQCGETVTQRTGNENLRLILEAVITETQRNTLLKMRSDPQSVKLVSAAYSGRVVFDELRWDRIADANGAETRTQGRIIEPLYEIQLQSKENSEN